MLTLQCDGDVARILAALADGYRLTGNFKGREADILRDAKGD